jgi:hypothetical protein
VGKVLQHAGEFQRVVFFSLTLAGRKLGGERRERRVAALRVRSSVACMEPRAGFSLLANVLSSVGAVSMR